MSLSWFVKSRGRRATDDYDWKPMGDARLSPADIFEEGFDGIRLQRLVNDEKPGLLLMNKGGRNILVVTGLIPPGNPTEFAGRQIRAMLLGVGGPDDLTALVAVAARALRGTLEADLPVAYPPISAGGFTVDSAAWEAYVRDAAKRLTGGTVTADAQRLDPDQMEFRRKVADDLIGSHAENAIARMRDRIIVLRTTLLDSTQIFHLKVWRCLSDAIERTQVPKASSDASFTDVLQKSVAGAARHFNDLRRTFLIVGVSLVVGAAVPYTLQASEPEPSPTPKPQPESSAPESFRAFVETSNPKSVKPGRIATSTWLVINADAAKWLDVELVEGTQGGDECAWRLPQAMSAHIRPGGTHLFTIGVSGTVNKMCTRAWNVVEKDKGALKGLQKSGAEVNQININVRVAD
ncbi:hypothetical protein GCM10009555_059370 [Acrocarpospora macrocephala]|uniref:Uncharacterized protein n=1 Tax=Acrocarpospora macrocephala TaxID=150177 RepID=A0A5M3X0N0_9ACTN|nr:hypothetical protein [Acrocarpospora macrocephala]GES11838.1 hypothetical protein Amac_054350 [Acrocarpospora macrocephala]